MPERMTPLQWAMTTEACDRACERDEADVYPCRCEIARYIRQLLSGGAKVTRA
jgi:hypothetical protein